MMPHNLTAWQKKICHVIVALSIAATYIAIFAGHQSPDGRIAGVHYTIIGLGAGMVAVSLWLSAALAGGGLRSFFIDLGSAAAVMVTMSILPLMAHVAQQGVSAGTVIAAFIVLGVIAAVNVIIVAVTRFILRRVR